VSERVPWIVAAAAAATLAGLLVATRRSHPVAHPDPRSGVTAERVLPPGMVLQTPQAAEAYAAARNGPQVLDGVYCHCECAKHFGHRSLLTCFESDHGAQCDICIGEALLATELAARGRSLADIRRAIDDRFGS
jgi:hypothetical protein